MSQIVAIGEWVRVQGFRLAGVRAVAAEDPAAVRAAWAELDRDAVVILTPAAAAALEPDTIHSGQPVVVLP